MSIDIKDTELLIRIGRFVWDFTKGDKTRSVMIQRISNELNLEENQIRDIILLGEKLGVLKPVTSNQVSVGPFAETYLSQNDG